MDKIKYDIYADGRIKSNGKRKMFLKGWLTHKGYNYVKINERTMPRHLVIAEHFLGKKPEGYTVNHKDGNKLNNHIDNLEFITREENYQHALDNNLKRNIGYYLTEEEASNMIEFYHNTNHTLNEIASWFGFTREIFRTMLKGDYKYKFRNRS